MGVNEHNRYFPFWYWHVHRGYRVSPRHQNCGVRLGAASFFFVRPLFRCPCFGTYYNSHAVSCVFLIMRDVFSLKCLVSFYLISLHIRLGMYLASHDTGLCSPSVSLSYRFLAYTRVKFSGSIALYSQNLRTPFQIWLLDTEANLHKLKN